MRCLNLVFVTPSVSFHSFDQECSTTSQIHATILRSLPNAYPKQTWLHSFSNTLLAERSSVFTDFKIHSFHSYQSISMHHSFAILSILAAPFVAAQSLSSIPSCAVSIHRSHNHGSPDADSLSPAPCSKSRYPKHWLRPQRHLHLQYNILPSDC